MTTTTPLSLHHPSPVLAIASLKDLDALGFVRSFEPAERARWEDWMRRLRFADDLAETNLEAFKVWRSGETWRDELPCDGMERKRRDAWSRYLAALDDYHRPGLVIRTLAEHDEMLLRLSGPLMQLMPGMPEELWDAAASFGALDQFWNNLRDMQEDAERGLCWLPEDVLREYGITREDVIAGRAPEMPGWRRFLCWWTVQHGWTASVRAWDLVSATDAPPAIQAMLDWTAERHDRTYLALRRVDYDHRRFPERYWAEVRREIGESARVTA